MSIVQFDAHFELNPPLSGVKSELWAIFNDPASGEDIYFNTKLPIPLSVNGMIDYSIVVGVPTSYRFIQIFPEQIVNGLTVRATQSRVWLGSATTVSQVLNIEVVEPPTDGAVVNPLILAGLVAAAVLLPRMGKG